MGIIVNLDVMMAKRKISLTELANQVDLTQANLSILKNNKAKAIRFSTLESICEVLHCQPGDILEYVEDSAAETDMNVVMMEDGRMIEVQGTAEGEPFSHEELLTLLGLAKQGCEQIFAAQRQALGL